MAPPAKSAAAPYPARLRMLAEGDSVALQPVDAGAGGGGGGGGGGRAGAGHVATLYVDLVTGAVSLFAKEPFPAGAPEVLGVLGLLRLDVGAALVVVTAAQPVAALHGRPVFRVAGTRVLLPRSVRLGAGQRHLLSLLTAGVDPSGPGRNLYISPGGDLTLSVQRLAELTADGGPAASQPPHARADPRFFWNRALSAPLAQAGADAFILTAVQGFVGALPPVAVPGAKGATERVVVTLVARRSVQRIGTRHWRRGADRAGAAANFVETEQIVAALCGPGEAAAAAAGAGAGAAAAAPSRALASFVQVRGSIPLVWSQVPDIRYKPTARLLGDRESGAAAEAHFASLLDAYRAVVAVNLVNQRGSEGRLAAAFKAEAERIRESAGAAGAGRLRYVAFDFHHECGATNYGRLSVLWDAIAADFKRHGFFLQRGPGGGAPPAAVQAGVVRTNCIDCLDRTNVVQGVLGRKARVRCHPPARSLARARALARACAHTLGPAAPCSRSAADAAPFLPPPAALSARTGRGGGAVGHGPAGGGHAAAGGPAGAGRRAQGAVGGPRRRHLQPVRRHRRAQVRLHAHGPAHAGRAAGRRRQERGALLPEQLCGRAQAGRAGPGHRRLRAGRQAAAGGAAGVARRPAAIDRAGAGAGRARRAGRPAAGGRRARDAGAGGLRPFRAAAAAEERQVAGESATAVAAAGGTDVRERHARV